MKKRISILGSSGSIGVNALKIVRHLKDEFEVVALAAKSNIDVLEVQAKEFLPQIIGVLDPSKAVELKKRLPNFNIVGGEEGILECATWSAADFVVSAISGFSGIKPTLAAIRKGKKIGLANKEALVAAGHLVISLAKENNVEIIPIDSEQSGVFQCLKGASAEDVHRLVLTASGGPFFHAHISELSDVTVDKALCHPNYRMGTKVTIDSSTLMNKGLEMIEAHFLFGIPTEEIKVVVHPQQIIHSFVEFKDGCIIAQMSEPNMLFPIQFAMTYPERKKSPLPHFDFTKHSLHFYQVDLQKFPCLDLAYGAIQAGGSMPCYMNAANEILVERFLRREIHWLDISKKLEILMHKHDVQKNLNIEFLCSIDTEARKEALTV
ncbi:MAG TPA: 1-deoxy-D-xylulose-5-phosphate reductoisomerase [Rhabdochlamydiaceae bacterium]|nr:1-deoxy-D-xylulose-5-phosphate reductoisomerase [Rhabdochlamydiaceae bacterium]